MSFLCFPQVKTHFKSSRKNLLPCNSQENQKPFFLLGWRDFCDPQEKPELGQKLLLINSTWLKPQPEPKSEVKPHKFCPINRNISFKSCIIFYLQILLHSNPALSTQLPSFLLSHSFTLPQLSQNFRIRGWEKKEKTISHIFKQSLHKEYFKTSLFLDHQLLTGMAQMQQFVFPNLRCFEFQ